MSAGVHARIGASVRNAIGQFAGPVRSKAQALRTGSHAAMAAGAREMTTCARAMNAGTPARAAVGLLALAGTAMIATAQPVVTDLGVLPGGNSPVARAMSGDGRVVIGSCDVGNTGRAFRWTVSTGMQDLGTLPGAASASAAGISRDGQVVVGTCTVSGLRRAFRWTESGGMESLPPPAGVPESIALSTSDDGSVVVGAIGNAETLRPAMWTSAGSWIYLGGVPQPGDAGGSGSCVNGDGSIAGGAFEGQAFRWSGGSGLVALPGVGGCQALSTTPAGDVFLGHCGGTRRATMWSRSGAELPLTLPAGTDFSVGYAVTPRGDRAVGYVHDLNVTPPVARAVVWTATNPNAAGGSATGTAHELATYIPALGGASPGWVFYVAYDISDDGRTICGTGRVNGVNGTWIVTGLPPLPCPADVNGIGGLTVQDVFDFLTAWFAGSPSADFNGVGGVTVQDVFDFLTAWFQGCA